MNEKHEQVLSFIEATPGTPADSVIGRFGGRRSEVRNLLWDLMERGYIRTQRDETDAVLRIYPCT